MTLAKVMTNIRELRTPTRRGFAFGMTASVSGLPAGSGFSLFGGTP